jgi:hypothetical protein
MFGYYRFNPLYWLAVPLVLLTVSMLGGIRGYQVAAESELNISDYEKIHNGMTQQEVEDALADTCADGDFVGGAKLRMDEDLGPVVQDGDMRWEYRGKSITVTFRDGKVVNKSQKGLK